MTKSEKLTAKMGRKKIQIARIMDERNRHVSGVKTWMSSCKFHTNLISGLFEFFLFTLINARIRRIKLIFDSCPKRNKILSFIHTQACYCRTLNI